VVDQRLSWVRFKVTYDGIEKGIYQPPVSWRLKSPEATAR
jgi:hypothetical protein